MHHMIGWMGTQPVSKLEWGGTCGATEILGLEKYHLY